MHRPGSILLVANYEPNVGYAWWLMENYWRLIAALAEQQQRRCILVHPVTEGASPKLGTSPVTIEQLDFGDTSVGGYVRLVKLLRRYRVRSVYLTDQPYFDLRYLIMRLFGVRMVVMHDHQPGERTALAPWKGAFKRLVHSLRVLSCTRYVAVSEFVRDRMIENARVLPHKCVVVRNGITVPDEDPASSCDTRAEFGIASSAVVVAIVARAHPYKRIDFAVRCAAQIERERPESTLHFLFCGDGPALQDLRSLIEELGVGHRFTLAGKRSDVRRILAQCDLAMHPSQGEVGFCLAILEAMDAGLPVLVPDIASVRGATEHGKTGLVYADGSIAEAVKHLTALELDSVFRSRLGKAARAVVRTEYNLEQTNRDFSRLVASKL